MGIFYEYCIPPLECKPKLILLVSLVLFTFLTTINYFIPLYKNEQDLSCLTHFFN